MYSRDQIAAMTEGLDQSKKKKKKKRKTPETYLEQASQYFEDFTDFARESSEVMVDFFSDSWQNVKASLSSLWNGKDEL